MVYTTPQPHHKHQKDAVVTLSHTSNGNRFCTFFYSVLSWAHLPHTVLMNARQEARSKGHICGHLMKTNNNNNKNKKQKTP